MAIPCKFPVASNSVAHTLLHLFSEVFGVSRQDRDTPLPEGCRKGAASEACLSKGVAVHRAVAARATLCNLRRESGKVRGPEKPKSRKQSAKSPQTLGTSHF